MKKRCLCKNLFLFVLIGFVSCTSQKINSDYQCESVLVYVIDENNQPVKDFEIQCFSSEKDGKIIDEGFTNRDGFCSINLKKSGRYFLNGQKNGFTILNRVEIDTEENHEIYFCSVNSLDSIFQNVEELFELKRYEKAEELLNSVFTEKESLFDAAVCFYKAVCFRKMQKNEESEIEIRKVEEMDLFENEVKIFEEKMGL